MILLKTSRLKVEIASPEEAPAAQTRFDLSGFIRQVTLDERHWFCTEEPIRSDLPCTMGAGICSEIVWPIATIFKRGNWFPKFGVGMLKKDDAEEYSFRKRYEYRIAPIQFWTEGNLVTFETESEETMGYRLKIRKCVWVENNVLGITYRFHNTGNKSLLLREYCHNFLTLDGLPAGADYYLKLSVKSQEGKLPRNGLGTMYGKENGFSFCGCCKEPSGIQIMEEELEQGPFFWELTNKKSKASVRGEDSFRPAQILIWAIDSNISPEVSNVFSLEKGEVIEYERKWIFNDEEN